jgi:hypothetical protein
MLALETPSLAKNAERQQLTLDKSRTANNLEDIRELAESGFAVHWLRPRSKIPFADYRVDGPVTPWSDLRSSYGDSFNVGVRLGEPSQVDGRYLHVLDVDIRVESRAQDALKALAALLPHYEQFPLVKSGSGGPSFHVYFLCKSAFRSRKIAHSAEQFVDADGKRHWEWEIELFGTGKQVAIPPSIHPDTGRPYRWLREFDFALFMVEEPYDVEASQVSAWLGGPADENDTPKERIGLTVDQAREYLVDLPLAEWCDDRDGWSKTGMALHHEFGADGYALWVEFSKQSPKFNELDQRRVWQSFGRRDSGRIVTMATVVKASRETRAIAMLDDLGPLDATSDPTPSATDGEKSRDWKKQLVVSPKGLIDSGLPNITLVLRYDSRFAGIAEANDFTLRIVNRVGIPKILPQSEAVPVNNRVGGDSWEDAHINAVRIVLEAPPKQGGYGMKVTDRDLKAAIERISRVSSFHPIRDYLGALRWDGRSRLNHLFIDYLGAPDDPYHRDTARLFCVAAVARVYEPGHKFDYVPIIEGAQGKRKSTFIQVLAREWFRELTVGFDDRNKLVEQMLGAWVMELPELQGFNRAEVQDLKAFVTSQSETVRLAWATLPVTYLRQCVFMGSTNERSYLRDATGGRRFWPIECKVETIDTERLEREIDQVWAEAVSVYRSMRREKPDGQLELFLRGEAGEMAVKIQENRRVETPDDMLSGQIKEWLDGPADPFDNLEDPNAEKGRRGVTCVREIWVECLKRPIETCQEQQARMVARIMEHGVLGKEWEKVGTRRFALYGNQKAYRRRL